MDGSESKTKGWGWRDGDAISTEIGARTSVAASLLIGNATGVAPNDLFSNDISAVSTTF